MSEKGFERDLVSLRRLFRRLVTGVIYGVASAGGGCNIL